MERLEGTAGAFIEESEEEDEETALSLRCMYV